MRHNYQFANVNDALPTLLGDLLVADEIGSRAGRTKELTHVGISLFDPVRREVLVKHRKPNLAAQIAESMWVLAGKDDVGWLSHYLPRAMDFSDDGETWRAGYGKRLRSWDNDFEEVVEDRRYVDQLAYVVDLLKRDPASRQAVMSIWDPVTDTQPGKDIPCNDWLSFSSRLGKLDLHVAIRSNDVVWGWSGINQFEWSVLLEVVAGILGLQVGALHFSTTSFHIYDRHWDKAARIVDGAGPTQWWNGLQQSPRFAPKERSLEHVDELLRWWFDLEKQIRSGDMSERGVNTFPEPMLQSFLRVLQWWWSGEVEYLAPLEGTALETAAREYSVQPPERGRVELNVTGKMQEFAREFGGTVTSEFVDEVIQLHNEKHEAYGPSWKKRGELFSIIPNIARKVDRLGSSETKDETSADTACDLMVYLAKYKIWLQDGDTDTTDAANQLMRHVDSAACPVRDQELTQQFLRDEFDEYLAYLEAPNQLLSVKIEKVNVMLWEATRLARLLWDEEADGDEYRGADVD
jgi:thymidylate synthase